MQDAEGLARRVAEKAGADPSNIVRALQRAVVRMPRVEPPPDEVSASPNLVKLLKAAQKIQKDNKESVLGK